LTAIQLQRLDRIFQSPVWTWTGRVLLILALTALAFLFLVYVLYAGALIRFPFDYDQGEGFELWDAVLSSRGEWIYRDSNTYPFYSSNYPPVFPLLLVPGVWLFGPHLWIGRAWSFIATLISGGAIFWIIYRETKDWTAALLPASAFFASNIVYQVGPLFRLQATMVMFGLLGVAMMSKVEEAGKGQRYLWASMLFLLLAGYTKQLAFDAVLAAFIFLFLRRPRQAVLYGAGFAIVVGLIFWGLNSATDGQWFINTMAANANPFIPGQALTFYIQWFNLHQVIILLAGLYVLYTLYVDRISVYSLYFVLSTAVGALSGKWGAGPAYFMTAIAAACIGAGLMLGILRRWLHQLAEQPSEQRRMWGRAGLAAFGIIVPLLFLYQARLNLHLPLDHPLTRPVARVLNLPEYDPNRFRQDYYDTVGYTQLGHLPNEEDIAAGWRIVEWARSTPGLVWSEEAAFEILAGKEVVTNPTQLLNLYQQGRLDTREMIEMINEQAFDVVIFRAQFYPLPVLDAFGQNYQIVEQITMNGFTYTILVPKE